MAEDDQTILFCSPNATRTQRSGIFELLYVARDDRTFCDRDFFRMRMTRQANTSDGCRSELYKRNETCHLE